MSAIEVLSGCCLLPVSGREYGLPFWKVEFRGRYLYGYSDTCMAVWVKVRDFSTTISP
jgi:hypothetical protein